MLDYMFRERSEEEDTISDLEEALKKEQKDNNSRISSLEYNYKTKLKEKENEIYKLKQDLNRLRQLSNPRSIDTTFMEQGLYAQLLFMVGRTNDAKKAAEEWIAGYEINNGLREPTPEEKKKQEKDLKELKKILEIAKNTPLM